MLNPGWRLFHEARFLLAEEPDLRDVALYHGVLSAIAAGNHTRAGIANYLARKSTDLGHALTVLTGTGMITHEPDAFHARRSAHRIAEPILTFYHAIMRPQWSDLERPGYADRLWAWAGHTFASKVVGPHFEQICRSWAHWYAGPGTLGGHRTRVASGTVPDPATRTSHEVDVAVFGTDDGVDNDAGGNVERLLVIGEAKWNEPTGLAHLRRLERILELLLTRPRIDARHTRLLCFGGAGFTDELRAAAEGSDTVQLVDLARLYRGA